MWCEVVGRLGHVELDAGARRGGHPVWAGRSGADRGCSTALLARSDDNVLFFLQAGLAWGSSMVFSPLAGTHARATLVRSADPGCFFPLRHGVTACLQASRSCNFIPF